MEPSDEYDNLLRPLRLEETFSRVYFIFREKWAVFLSLSAISILFTYAVSLLFLFVPVKVYDSNYDYDEYNEDVSTPNDVFSLSMFWLSNLIYYAIVAVSDGALVRATAELYVGETPTVYNSIVWGLKKFWPLMASLLLVAFCVGTPFIVLIGLFLALGIPSVAMLLIFLGVGVAFFVTVVTYHIYPAIMVEHKGAMDSIARSWDLSSDFRGYIFCCLLLFNLAKFIINLGIQGLAAGSGVFAVALDLCFHILFACLGSILQAVVYFSVRVQKEGLNLEGLLQELQINGETPYATMEAQTASVPVAADVVKDLKEGEMV